MRFNNLVVLNILRWKLQPDNTIVDVDELKTCLIDKWAQFDQSIIDAAISQWRRRLSACVRARGAHWAKILTIFKTPVLQTYNSAKWTTF